MKRLLATLLLAVLLLSPTRVAAALVDPPIAMRDPGAYARAFADSMALMGMRPVREAFELMLGQSSPLSAEIEGALTPYENPEMIKPALVSRVLDDVAVADTYRAIYLYHYYGGNYWVFTRLEFARISTTEWALTRIAFSDRWSNVALATTPGFENEPRRR